MALSFLKGGDRFSRVAGLEEDPAADGVFDVNSEPADDPASSLDVCLVFHGGLVARDGASWGYGHPDGPAYREFKVIEPGATRPARQLSVE